MERPGHEEEFVITPLLGPRLRANLAYPLKHQPKVQSRPANGSKNLPAVHRVISLVKRWLLGVHQGAVRPHHLQVYLDEYAFRFNRRRSSHPIKLFHRLAQQLVVTKPRSYAAIAGREAQGLGAA